ncbi:MAG: hypothetical protein PF692_07505 [Kiritimatiellae bacterium]|jgi:hypothetical protein|nr:hypothetical protein [Kiritimatiellia bacterium]
MTKEYKKRFFNDESFWNQPISANADLSEKSNDYIQLLKEIGEDPGFHINVNSWTIPVYYADEKTPVYKLSPKIMDCYLSQGHLIASEPYLNDEHPKGIHKSASDGVPIPHEAEPDGEHDAHMTVIDLEKKKCYDMWQIGKQKDGSWATNAAIAYDLDGSGVYDINDFSHVHNDESIHYYGPCRASGVPIIAGLIMHHEIEAGKIEHKLAFACQQVGLQKFAYPAVWTDGWRPNGIPEGITIQLDPKLDLEKLNLSTSGKIIAKALQTYGAVLIDYCGGCTFYAEGLFDKNDKRKLDNILTEVDVKKIGFENYRFIKPERVIHKGSHPIYHNGMSLKYYDYLKELKHVPQSASPLKRIHD